MKAAAVMAVLLAGGAAGHVTMNPNTGLEGGGYFVTDVKVPHGRTGHDTWKIEVVVPQGTKGVVPEKKHGWDITVEERTVPEYTSHGKTKNTAPAKITWTAQDGFGLHTKLMENFKFQVNTFCSFNDAASNIKWQGNYVLWFPTTQHTRNPTNASDTGKLEWTGVPKSEWAAWNDGTPSPSPYVKMTAWPRCPDKQITWFGTKLSEPAPEKPMVMSGGGGGGDDTFEDHWQALVIIAFILSILNFFAIVFAFATRSSAPAPASATAPDAPTKSV